MENVSLLDVRNPEVGDGVIVFGFGNYGKWTEFFLDRDGIKIHDVFDNNVEGVETWTKRRTVKPYRCKNKKIGIVIAVSDSALIKELSDQSIELGYVNIYRINVTAIGDMIKALPDYDYLKIRFYMRMGSELNLETPQTFNEKLNWIKLYDRKPIYTTMVDKYNVKEYVAGIIGREHTIPTIAVWDKFDDINPAILPERFVLKCTHDSGSVVICKDKSTFDWGAARKKLETARKKNYFWADREWPYKDVQGRIICEEYIDSDHEVLDVYKIFNFMGEPELIQMIQDDKTENETIDYFDTEWNLLDLRQNYPNSTKHREKPEMLEVILTFARKLSEGIPFVRTDFYISRGKVYFSEFTFFSDSGCERFYPDKWDKILGDKIQLPVK